MAQFFLVIFLVPNIGLWGAYLIIVTTATTGGGVPFSSRRTFSTENAKWTVFRKVYSENKNTEYSKENTKYAKKNTKYAK